MPGTVTLHRVVRAKSERVYRAFLDPAAMCKWLPPHGFTGTVHSAQAKVGGKTQMSFTNFNTGHSHSFSIEYKELRPGEFLHYVDRFDDPNMPGDMPVTVHLRSVMGLTEIKITQAGIPDMIPVEMCYLGWQESLAQLAKLVEPVIPD